MGELTWAPIIINGRDKNDISSTNEKSVDPIYCTYERYTDPQVAWIYGLRDGQALVKFHRSTEGGLGDPDPKFLRVEVNVHASYAVSLDSSALMIVAPDRDLRHYKLEDKIQTTGNMTPKELFTKVLDKISQIKGGRLRNLVFQCHGTAGILLIFGKHNRLQYLDNTNVEQFKRLAGKVDAIWMLSCTTCIDQNYREAVAKEADAHVIGATMANDQIKMALRKNEIEFHINSAPVAVNGHTLKTQNRNNFVGAVTVGAHLFGGSGLASFRPA